MDKNRHKPLSWIKENLIFLPVSGPHLKGQPVGKHILKFQEDVILSALNPDGSFNKNVFLGFSRKISKSLIYSWIFNYLLENKEGMSLVNMASTYSQSNIIFSLIREQILLNEHINSKHYKIRVDSIQNTVKHNRLDKIFSKSSSNLGMLNISALIGDEIGAMQSRENLNSIMSGLAMAQGKPLLLFASNPPELESHWSNEYLKTLSTDDEWVFFDYSAPLKLDPYAQRTKCLANPFYKEYVERKTKTLKSVFDFVNKEADRAKKSAENLIVYRRFQLGQRVSPHAYQWVDVKDIQFADEKVFENKQLRPILSFDLSLSFDFCACLICLFDEASEDIYLYPILHIANTENRRQHQRKRFSQWHTEGFIKLQDRKAIDKSIFCADVKNTLKKFKVNVEKTVWDRNLSEGWHQEFESEPELYRGTASELSHAIRFVEARSKEGKLHIIGKNECLKWMFENAICSRKSKGFTLLDRSSVFDSIDGAVCSVMATKYFIEHRKQKFIGFSI